MFKRFLIGCLVDWQRVIGKVRYRSNSQHTPMMNVPHVIERYRYLLKKSVLMFLRGRTAFFLKRQRYFRPRPQRVGARPPGTKKKLQDTVKLSAPSPQFWLQTCGESGEWNEPLLSEAKRGGSDHNSPAKRKIKEGVEARKTKRIFLRERQF